MTSPSDQPAFPAMHFDLGDGEHGMTLRDYFAAKAMQALLMHRDTADELVLAADAYIIADGMLHARDAKA